MIYDYKTVCRITKDSNWIKKFDNKQKAAYAFNGFKWMSYVSFDSLRNIVIQKEC
jgi:hypothetical protein